MFTGTVDECSSEKVEINTQVGLNGGDWMFKRRSICHSGPGQCSSYALSPSVHRDIQQTGNHHYERD